MIVEPTVRDIVLGTKLGLPVTAPSGFDGFVQRSFRDGGKFLTADGEQVYPTPCSHTDAERMIKGSLIAFEQVGPGNRDWADGTVGIVHRFSRCNKVVLSE